MTKSRKSFCKTPSPDLMAIRGQQYSGQPGRSASRSNVNYIWLWYGAKVWSWLKIDFFGFESSLWTLHINLLDFWYGANYIIWLLIWSQSLKQAQDRFFGFESSLWTFHINLLDFWLVIVEIMQQKRPAMAHIFSNLFAHWAKMTSPLIWCKF